MKIKAQVGMVLNLDKCIGCHTCSISCKQVWTNREGMDYAWFNNVETKPGIGYPKNWEDQEKYKGGWELSEGKLQLKAGSKLKLLSNIFANPYQPEMSDYYEPFDMDYQHLHNAPANSKTPTAMPYSKITGEKMDKITGSANWEDDLSGTFADRSQDKNFDGIQKKIYGEFEQTFMMYMPRLCEHCLNPSCVASCPSGAIYKRDDDGIVLIDQEKCRGWRMCISSCPYKKIYFNWKSSKSEKCIFCYPRMEAGMPTVCSETCVGRIRYLGVMLYDADKIESAASKQNPKDLYPSQNEIFLDPNDPKVIEEALKQGIPQNWLDSAQKSPMYKMVMEWEIALPLHPEYRTLPMVWYIPPLSPITAAAEAGDIPVDRAGIPKVEDLRIPVRYLANMLSAGDESVITSTLRRLSAMRIFMRDQTVNGKENKEVAEEVGFSVEQIKEMYKYLALARYEDRFVIPTVKREKLMNPELEKMVSGFNFNNAGKNPLEGSGGSGGLLGCSDCIK